MLAEEVGERAGSASERGSIEPSGRAQKCVKHDDKRQWKGWGGAAENRGGHEGMQGMGDGALCYFDLGLAGDNACG